MKILNFSVNKTEAPELSALPGWAQQAREIAAIFNDPRFKGNGVFQITCVSTESGENSYIVETDQGKFQVDIKHVSNRSDKDGMPIIGPVDFELVNWREIT